MNKSFMISKIQLVSDQITFISRDINHDIIEKIESCWQCEEAISYIYKVEEIVTELKSINSYLDELMSICTK